jgi:GNAT superfamily N-acetyltransferase
LLGLFGTLQTAAAERLLAHIISTRTHSTRITDDDMAIPSADTEEHVLGHRYDSRTLAIHIVASSPDYTGIGLGSLLMKRYIGSVKQAGMVDRMALICQKACLA